MTVKKRYASSQCMNAGVRQSGQFLSQALWSYVNDKPAPLLTNAFAALPAQSIDGLPHDWRRRLAQILASKDERAFSTVVADSMRDFQSDTAQY